MYASRYLTCFAILNLPFLKVLCYVRALYREYLTNAGKKFKLTISIFINIIYTIYVNTVYCVI